MLKNLPRNLHCLTVFNGTQWTWEYLQGDIVVLRAFPRVLVKLRAFCRVAKGLSGFPSVSVGLRVIPIVTGVPRAYCT